MRRIVAACAAVGLVAVPTAAAKPTAAIPISDQAFAVAAAPGRAVVVEPDPFVHNLLAVRELRFADRSNRVMAEIPVTDDTITHIQLAANATGYLLALSDDRDRLILGGYDGALHVLVDCAGSGPETQVTAGAHGFAFLHPRCPGLPDAATVGPDGLVTPFAAPPDAAMLTYAEPFVTTGTLDAVTVTDLASGVSRRLPQLSIGVDAALRVLADGTLVFAKSGFDFQSNLGLYAWPPSAPSPTRLDERADAAPIAAAGGRIVYGSSTGTPRIVGLGGGPSRALPLPGAGQSTPLGFDGTRAAFAGYSCSGGSQITIADVDAPREPGSVNGCPVRLTRHAVRFDRAGRARLSIVCRNGCGGSLDLRQRATRRHPCGASGICPTLASARLDLPPSSRPRRITLELTENGSEQTGHRFATQTSFTQGALTRIGEIRRARL
jgi:hypothetical protein